MTRHPVRVALADEGVLASVERWAEFLLAETGAATVEVVIKLNVKDRRCLGVQFGGTSSRKSLTPAPDGA